MKAKVKILILLICAGSFIILSCHHHRGMNNRASEEKIVKKVVYTCEMDTDVRSDKPGKCPKCGMDLVKKEEK